MFRGFDTARFLKSISGGLLFTNGDVGIETRIRCDNSSAVEHVPSTNLVTKERRLSGLLESKLIVG